MTIHVRPATAEDAPELSRLGASTFRDTFEGEKWIGEMVEDAEEQHDIERPDPLWREVHHVDVDIFDP